MDRYISDARYRTVAPAGFGAAIFLCVGGVFALRHWMVRIRHANIGALAGDETTRKLDRLPDAFAVMNDVAFRRFNVVHVVVEPTGVRVIETKSQVGPVEETREGLYVAGRPWSRDPRKQGRGNARGISDLLREKTRRRYWVEASVSFPYAQVYSNQHADNTRVVGGENLCHRIQNALARLVLWN